MEQVTHLRKELGQITAYKNGQPSRKRQNLLKNIKRRHSSHINCDITNITIESILDTVRQTIVVVSNKLRRHRTCNLRKTNNILFRNYVKQFYRILRGGTNK